MTAYYNEIDPFAAQWLRNLIDAGAIPAGDVDERSIKEVTADDVRGYTQCHWFAGIGGWALALRLAGWADDVPVWTGSCPCQPLSSAGKREGEMDERHLWPDFYRLIAQCRPAIVFGEQVESADGLEWLDGISLDLEELGFAFGAADLPGASVKAPHRRQRLYWVADASIPRQAGRKDARANSDDASQGARRSEPQRSGSVGMVADAGSQRQSGEQLRLQPRESRQAGIEVGRSSGTGGLADARCAGVRGEGLRTSSTAPDGVQGANGKRKWLRPDAGAIREVVAGGWSDAIWLPCTDGKLRRAQPESFPLAPGIPVSMGRGRSKQRRMEIRAARANRTGRLKGYGNAIIPQVAAEFIAAYVESAPAQRESE